MNWYCSGRDSQATVGRAEYYRYMYFTGQSMDTNPSHPCWHTNTHPYHSRSVMLQPTVSSSPSWSPTGPWTKAGQEVKRSMECLCKANHIHLNLASYFAKMAQKWELQKVLPELTIRFSFQITERIIVLFVVINSQEEVQGKYIVCVLFFLWNLLDVVR